MSDLKITVPDMGDFKDVEIIEVLVKEGETINKNDSLITLESDKSSVEVPSTQSGTINKINVKKNKSTFHDDGEYTDFEEVNEENTR